MFGIDDALASFAGAAFGGLTDWFGQKSANDTNQRIAREQMDFQRESNQKAMDFSHNEAGISREWSAGQAKNLMDFNSAEALKARGFTAEQAQKAMDFSERMSNTSWQRGVEDMKKAGINPMLGVAKGIGGASSPSGLGATGVQATGAMGSTSAPSGHSSSGAAIPVRSTTGGIAQAINSAFSLQRAKLDIDQIRQNVINSMKQGRLIDSQVENVKSQTGRTLVDTGNLSAQTAGLKGEEAVDRSTFGKVMRYLGRLNPFGHSASAVIRAVK